LFRLPPPFSGSRYFSVGKDKMVFRLLEEVAGKPPSERYGHSAVEYKGYIYIFGGNSAETFSSETFRFDIGTTTFHLLKLNWSLPNALKKNGRGRK